MFCRSLEILTLNFQKMFQVSFSVSSIKRLALVYKRVRPLGLLEWLSEGSGEGDHFRSNVLERG